MKKSTATKEPQRTPDERINGSGLFHFRSSLSKSEKLKIVNWYESLDKEKKGFIDTLRSESSDEAQFFADGD